MTQRTFFFPLSILLIGLITGCSSARTIVVGEELSAHSNQWVAKTEGGGAMRLTRFGRFNMVSYEKIESRKLASPAQPGLLHLWKEEMVTKKMRSYKLIVADDQTAASIQVSISQTKIRRESGLFTLNIAKDDGPVSNLKDARGEIRFNGDTTAAYFELNGYAGESMESKDFYTSVSGTITYQSDNFYFQNIIDSQDGRPGLGHKISKGIIVSHPELGQVAALQLYGDAHIWMQKDLPPKTQLLIASVFSVLLGSRICDLQSASLLVCQCAVAVCLNVD